MNEIHEVKSYDEAVASLASGSQMPSYVPQYRERPGHAVGYVPMCSVNHPANANADSWGQWGNAKPETDGAK